MAKEAASRPKELAIDDPVPMQVAKDLPREAEPPVLKSATPEPPALECATPGPNEAVLANLG